MLYNFWRAVSNITYQAVGGLSGLTFDFDCFHKPIRVRVTRLYVGVCLLTHEMT